MLRTSWGLLRAEVSLIESVGLCCDEIFLSADGEYSNQGSEGGRNPVNLGLEQSLESYTAQGYNPEDPHLRLGQVCDLAGRVSSPLHCPLCWENMLAWPDVDQYQS